MNHGATDRWTDLAESPDAWLVTCGHPSSLGGAPLGEGWMSPVRGCWRRFPFP